jgi:hypothetical protein
VPPCVGRWRRELGRGARGGSCQDAPEVACAVDVLVVGTVDAGVSVVELVDPPVVDVVVPVPAVAALPVDEVPRVEEVPVPPVDAVPFDAVPFDAVLVEAVLVEAVLVEAVAAAVVVA